MLEAFERNHDIGGGRSERQLFGEAFVEIRDVSAVERDPHRAHIDARHLVPCPLQQLQKVGRAACDVDDRERLRQRLHQLGHELHARPVFDVLVRIELGMRVVLLPDVVAETLPIPRPAEIDDPPIHSS